MIETAIHRQLSGDSGQHGKSISDYTLLASPTPPQDSDALSAIMAAVGKGAPLRWMENLYLRHHLRGKGIEIGGLWRKFKVPAQAKVWYLDRLSVEELTKQYELDCGIVTPDLIADAEQLPVASGSLNFLIASHVLE